MPDVARDPRRQARRRRARRRSRPPSASSPRRSASSAARWTELKVFYTSPGFSDERVWLFLATDLSAAAAAPSPSEDERIEIVPWPLDQLDDAIAECEDSKSLIALLWLALARERGIAVGSVTGGRRSAGARPRSAARQGRMLEPWRPSIAAARRSAG